MWILCCGPVRSGSTLQYNITREIVERTKSGKVIDYEHPSKFGELQTRYANTSGYKVFKTHFLTDEMLGLIKGNKAKCISCYRDIRDVIVSAVHKEGDEINDESDFTKFTKDYLQYHHDLSELPNTLISRYEDFYKDIQNECLRILNHLELTLPNDAVKDISDNLHFVKAQKYIERANKSTYLASNGKEYIIDQRTMLHDNHFKHIHPGSYKRHLKGMPLRKVEQIADKWLRANGYEIRLDWRSILIRGFKKLGFKVHRGLI